MVATRAEGRRPRARHPAQGRSRTNGPHVSLLGENATWYQRVWNTTKVRGRPMKKNVPCDQAERTVAWFPRKYRRLVVRWERLAACFIAFLALALLHMWVHRLIVG